MNKCIIIIVILILGYILYNEYILLYINNKILEKFTSNTTHRYETNNKPWYYIRENYIDIKNEYNTFIETIHYPELFYKQEQTTSITIDKNKSWRSIFLRMYNQDTDYVKYFPKTMDLIRTTECITALFSILEPDTILLPHKGVDKGVLRYHIAIQVPQNYKDCFLSIKGNNGIEKYNWQEGKDILFDDLFEHSAENNTSETRVVLLLDIKRDFNNKLLRKLHDSIINNITKNKLVKNTINIVNNKLTTI